MNRMNTTIATLVLAALPLSGCEEKKEYQTITVTPIAVNTEYGHGCGAMSIPYGDQQTPTIAHMDNCGLHVAGTMQQLSDAHVLLDLAVKNAKTIEMTGTLERNGTFDVKTLVVGGHTYWF